MTPFDAPARWRPAAEGRVVHIANCGARDDECLRTGERPVGAVVLDAALRLFRTEFWW